MTPELPTLSVTVEPDLTCGVVGHRLHVRSRMDESEIRHRFDELAEPIRAMDLDRVMSIYAAGIVSFDVEPPLQHVGAAAKRKSWGHGFSVHQGPLREG